MAASQREICNICKRESGQVTCKGCSKTFCINHFNGHRQQLETQLYTVEVERDVFRQDLTESIAHPENHVLIRQVNQWENESYTKIKKVAAETRQMLIEHMQKSTTNLEQKLKALTDQLRASRDKNEFNELDLNGWKTTLTNMKKELQNFPTIKVIESTKPLISDINVVINEENSKYYSCDSPNVNSNLFSKNDLKCPFCSARYCGSEIGAHLTSCGNKTEQCRKCKKYIRRAILTYHDQNNCAPDPDISTPQNEKPMVTVKCTYCKQDCLQSDCKTHGENCDKNPDKQKNSKRFFSNYRRQSNDFNQNVGIPCEWCFQPIPFENYQRHVITCRDEEHRKSLEKYRAREVVKTPSKLIPTATNQCKFCKHSISVETLSYHELACDKNPKRQLN